LTLTKLKRPMNYLSLTKKPRQKEINKYHVHN
jgi:hypothetical protein